MADRPSSATDFCNKIGNILTEEEQWAKLKLAVDVAGEMWGK